MKQLHSISILAIVLFAAGCGGAPSEQDESATQDAITTTGNGGPSGPHFDLNIIGVSNAKQVSGSGGSVIFVPLSGTCKIDLVEGPFQVLDNNCTDGLASFQLPNPDPTNSGTTTYSVFARALGKPGGSSRQTTCATDPTTGTQYCSIDSSLLTRTGGQSKFTNVSKELLYVYADIGSGLQHYALFDSALTDYLWSYDNTGLRLAQLRFYQVSTTVPAQ